MRWSAIGRPMMPSPTKPTFMRFLPRVALLRAGSGDAVILQPAEARLGAVLRLVLAADPALVADPVDVAEEELVVDLAGAGLVAAGRVGELHVGDAREVRLDRRGEVTLHDLHVVDVVLEGDVFARDLVDQLERLARGVEVEAGDVARVDRL